MSHSVTEVLGVVYTVSTNVSGQYVHSRLERTEVLSRSLVHWESKKVICE